MGRRILTLSSLFQQYGTFTGQDSQSVRVYPFADKRLTANGLSSSHLIYNPNQTENKERSRRVEFKIKTNAEQQIIRILEQSK